MSQSGAISGAQPGTGDLLTLSGDLGNTVQPDVNGNISILSDNPDLFLVLGSLVTSELTIAFIGVSSQTYKVTGGDTITYNLTINSASLIKFDILGVSDDLQDVFGVRGMIPVVNDGTGVETRPPSVNSSGALGFTPAITYTGFGNDFRITIVTPGSNAQTWKVRTFETIINI